MFKIVSWVVPTFCSSTFDCQCMRQIMHSFLWFWYLRRTLWLLI